MIKKILVGALITALLAICVFILVLELKREKKAAGIEWPPHLAVGDTIGYFDLIDVNGKHIDASILKTKKPSLIFLFPRSYNLYSNDISYWSRMASIVQDNAQIFGIFLGMPREFQEFRKERKIPFDLYFPDNLDLFLKQMNVKSILGHIMLCSGGKVEMVRVGSMEGESYTEFLRRTLELAQTGE